MAKASAQQDADTARAPVARLAASADALLQGLEADIAAAEHGAPVHGARRRIKRLRSYIRLVRKVAGEDAARAASGHLKAAADALSGLRRQEALQAAASRLEADLTDAKPLQELIARYHAGHAASLAPADALARARQELTAAHAMMAMWTLAPEHLPDVQKAFVGTYGKARKLLRGAFDSKDPEALHEARKFVIHHMHHLELLAAGGQAKRIGALNRLRELLGDFNDLVELEQVAGSDAPKPVLKAIHARRKALLARARRARKPLFESGPKSFAGDIAAIWQPDAP